MEDIEEILAASDSGSDSEFVYTPNELTAILADSDSYDNDNDNDNDSEEAVLDPKILPSSTSTMHYTPVVPTSLAALGSAVHSSDDWVTLQEILDETEDGDGDEDPISKALVDSLLNENGVDDGHFNDDIVNDGGIDMYSQGFLYEVPIPVKKKKTPRQQQQRQQQQQQKNHHHNQHEQNHKVDDDTPNSEEFYETYHDLTSDSFALDNTHHDSEKKSSEKEMCPPAPEQLPSDIASSSSFSPTIVQPSSTELTTPSISPITVAEKNEKRMLGAGTREIVAPLAVKRKMRPNLLLPTRSRSRSSSSNELDFNSTATTTTTTTTTTGSSDSSVPSQHEIEKLENLGVAKVERKPAISRQLEKNSGMSEVGAGMPTSVTVSSKFICVGTELGVVMVFDHFQSLQCMLRLPPRQSSSTPNKNNKNSRDHHHLQVTSIDILDDYLISAYSDGSLVLFDCLKGNPLKQIQDCHPTAITSVNFIHETDTVVVTVDGKGLVNMITFSKTLWNSFTVESECLLDGSAGIVPAMSVLRPIPNTPPSAVRLIALSSEKSSFCVGVTPAVKVLHKWAKPANYDVVGSLVGETVVDESVPCLAWGRSLIQNGGRDAIPVLARGWGKCVQLLTANYPDNGAAADEAPAFGAHEEFTTPLVVMSVQWVTDRTLGYLTVDHRFSIVDTVTMTLVDRISIQNVVASYQNSIISIPNGGCLFVLSKTSLDQISLRGWDERISNLADSGQWLEALSLALDFHSSETATLSKMRTPSAEGELPTLHPAYNSASRSNTEKKIANYLIRYLHIAFDNAPKDSGTFESHFEMLTGVAIDYCIMIGRLDLLYSDEVFGRFVRAGCAPIFVDLLAPFVMRDRLTYIAPEAMGAFVDHCHHSGALSRFECCLLHLNVKILDFDSVIKLLKRNHMFSALFHVYNRGLGDYVAPLEIILEHIFDIAEKFEVQRDRSDGRITNLFEKLGYKALLYLRSCSIGRSFPIDDALVSANIANLHDQLIQFLSSSSWSPSRRNVSDDMSYWRAQSFPYMRIFLVIDTKLTLTYLRDMIDAMDLSADDRLDLLIIDSLTSIIVDDEFFATMTPPPAKFLFCQFLSDLIMSNGLVTNPKLSHFVIETTVKMNEGVVGGDGGSKAVVGFLERLPPSAYDRDYLIKILAEPKLYRPMLILHQLGCFVSDGKQGFGHFRLAVECYFKIGTAEMTAIFSFIRNEMQHKMAQQLRDDSIIEKMRLVIHENLVDLISIGAQETVSLLTEIGSDCRSVLDMLIQTTLGTEKECFLFEYMAASQYLSQSRLNSSQYQSPDESGAAVDSAASGLGTQISDSDSGNLNEDERVLFVKLQAKHKPRGLYNYLRQSADFGERTEECLRVSREYNIADASSLLLERQGKVGDALRLILKSFEESLVNLKLATRQGQDGDRAIAMQILNVGLELCKRNTVGKGDNEEDDETLGVESYYLYFSVLDRIMKTKHFLRLDRENDYHQRILENIIAGLFEHLMQTLVDNIPLHIIIKKITQDHSLKDLREFREIIISIFGLFSFEVKLCENSERVCQSDLRYLTRRKRELKIRGMPAVPTPWPVLTPASTTKSKLRKKRPRAVCYAGTGARRASMRGYKGGDTIAHAAGAGAGAGGRVVIGALKEAQYTGQIY